MDRYKFFTITSIIKDTLLGFFDEYVTFLGMKIQSAESSSKYLIFATCPQHELSGETEMEIIIF